MMQEKRIEEQLIVCGKSYRILRLLGHGKGGYSYLAEDDGQQNADFVLEIAETGSYHIFVSGHQAKGNISFTRIPEKTE